MRCASLLPSALFPLVCAVCLFGLASPAAAAIQLFSDGGVHTVNSNIAPDSIEVRDSLGLLPTTVTVAAGASVGATAGSSVSVFDNSIYNQTGGVLLDELFLFNNATTTITGGQIVDDITTSNNSSANVSSVTVDDDLEACGNSLMNISGGNYNEDVESFETATVNITGGTFQTGSDGANIEAAGNSIINISGGSFGTGETDGAGYIAAIENATINIFGGDVSGQPEGLKAEGNGVINVYGLGGQPASLNVTGSGIINVLDGSLQNLTSNGSGVVKLFGTDGALTNISAQGTTVIKIFGSNFFAFNGAVPLGPGAIPFVSGNLTGLLRDGTMITNVNFSRNFQAGARIELVPEPSTLLLTALSWAGLVVASRRRGR